MCVAQQLIALVLNVNKQELLKKMKRFSCELNKIYLKNLTTIRFQQKRQQHDKPSQKNNHLFGVKYCMNLVE